MKISGAEIIVRCLLEHGVDTVFGYPGGRILPLYDALYEGAVRHVRTSHEQGAIHAADGYARASGRVGVCIATSGPGATNLVTGLANAYLDSVPVVVITGQVSTDLIGADAFQEVDITGITMPVTKHNFLVKNAEDLPQVMRLAFKIASTGRPGPVLVDVPSDIQNMLIEFNPPLPANEASLALTARGEELLDKAAAAIQGASRPLIIVGGGAVTDEVCRGVKCLAEKLQVPVVSTLMGLGVFPSAHPQLLGMTGMHGCKAANHAVHGADVIIAVGSRFSDRVTNNKEKYGEGKMLIHMDVDPAEIDKNISSYIGLAGDLAHLLPQLAQRVQTKSCPQWWEEVKGWQESFVEYVDDGSLTGPWLLKQAGQAAAGKPFIFATDVGQHQMWSAQNIQLDEPRAWITSGGLGAMGFGLPSAVGAQLAQPDKRVVCVVGDGGIKMTGCEFFTIVSEKLPVITIIIDNSCLGMVRQLQELFYKERYSASLTAVQMDFVAFAQSFGIEGRLATTQAEFNAALAAAMAADTPQVIVARVETMDLVKPMLVPGGYLDKHIDM